MTNLEPCPLCGALPCDWVDNPHRTGQLVPVPSVDKLARVIAPHLEGGREFDQMPPDSRALKTWSRSKMCSINDATQDDAAKAACLIIATLTGQN